MLLHLRAWIGQDVISTFYSTGANPAIAIGHARNVRCRETETVLSELGSSSGNLTQLIDIGLGSASEALDTIEEECDLEDDRDPVVQAKRKSQ